MSKCKIVEVIKIKATENPWDFKFPKGGRMWWSGDAFFLDWVIAATKEYWNTQPVGYDRTFKDDSATYSNDRRKADRKAWHRDLKKLRREAKLLSNDTSGRSYVKLFVLLNRVIEHFWH